MVILSGHGPGRITSLGGLNAVLHGIPVRQRSSETSKKATVNRITRDDPARGLKRGDPEGAYPARPKRVERHFNKQAKR